MNDEIKTVSACTDNHCVTCSDEALEAAVVGVDHNLMLAIVQIGQATSEIDVSLVDALAPGDRVLIHGGVAIAKL